LTTNAAVVEVQPFRSLTKPEKLALEAAAAQYGRFMGLPVTLTRV